MNQETQQEVGSLSLSLLLFNFLSLSLPPSEDMPDLFKYSQSTSYPVRSLGVVSPLPLSAPHSDPQTATLSLIDKTQVYTHTLSLSLRA